MDLDDFVSETLRQILSGVAKAQAADLLGPNVNAAFPGILGSNLSAAPGFGVFARVDFDVAVTAETSKGGKGSIKVWSIGAEGGAEHKSQTVSRVVFAVPLRLPDGDQTKQIEADRKDEEHRQQMRALANRNQGGSGWGG